MSPVQEAKFYCDGCEKNCELWANVHTSGSIYATYYIHPMIGDMAINKYIDEFGKECDAGIQLKNYSWDSDDSMVFTPLPQGALKAALERATHQARLAARHCPHYHKTK